RAAQGGRRHAGFERAHRGMSARRRRIGRFVGHGGCAAGNERRRHSHRAAIARAGVSGAHLVNTIGLRTLFSKETRRFLRVPGQTVAQPVVTTTLYFLVFGFALGGRLREIDGVTYLRFIVPGLVMLSLITNAFLNTSSSMFIAKIQGTIVDLLVAPLSVAELLAAFVGAALVRALLVGIIVWAVAGIFTGFGIAHPLWVAAFAVIVSVTFALVGLGVAIWSDKFEQLNLVPTFVITP